MWDFQLLSLSRLKKAAGKSTACGDTRPGCAVHPQGKQHLPFGVAANTLCNNGYADGVAHRTQCSQECLVSWVVLHIADEAGIDFQVVQAHVVQRAQLGRLMTEMFDPHFAAPVLQAAAECLECIDMPEGDRLWNFDTQAFCCLRVLCQFAVYPVAKTAVGDCGHRQVDCQRVRCAVESRQRQRHDMSVQYCGELQAMYPRQEFARADHLVCMFQAYQRLVMEYPVFT